MAYFFNCFCFGFFYICATIFLADFTNVDMRSLNGLISRDKERARESDSLPCSYTFLHMHIHTCIQNINPQKMKGASAAEKSGIYTRALDGHKCNGFKQHINARVHLAFHSIWHCYTHTHNPSLSSGPHWLSSKCLGASGIQLAFGAGLRHNLTLRSSSYSTPFCLGGWKNTF